MFITLINSDKSEIAFECPKVNFKIDDLKFNYTYEGSDHHRCYDEIFAITSSDKITMISTKKINNFHLSVDSDSKMLILSDGDGWYDDSYRTCKFKYENYASLLLTTKVIVAKSDFLGLNVCEIFPFRLYAYLEQFGISTNTNKKKYRIQIEDKFDIYEIEDVIKKLEEEEFSLSDDTIKKKYIFSSNEEFRRDNEKIINDIVFRLRENFLYKEKKLITEMREFLLESERKEFLLVSLIFSIIRKRR